MPEGDSVAGNAAMLRPILVGEVVTAVYGIKGPLRANLDRIRGRLITGIRTRGKNLVIDLDSGYSLLVHLGMSGRWRTVSVDRSVPGSASVALTTRDHHAVCVGAPTVEVDRTPAIDAVLARLGPDLLDEDVDTAEIVGRARVRSGTLSEILLDQSVAAGIGNVYKSELAFLAGAHPDSPVESLTDEQLAAVYDDARRLLALNVGPGRRSTTGSRRRDRSTWVYGRAGRACLRCGSRVESSMSANRVTYWCPGCQPLL